jgi:hypothetical protein
LFKVHQLLRLPRDSWPLLRVVLLGEAVSFPARGLITFNLRSCRVCLCGSEDNWADFLGLITKVFFSPIFTTCALKKWPFIDFCSLKKIGGPLSDENCLQDNFLFYEFSV